MDRHVYDVRAYDRTEFISPVQYIFLISETLSSITISRKAAVSRSKINDLYNSYI